MGGALSSFLRRLALALGLAAYAGAVSFSAPTVEEGGGGERRVVARLENAVTEEIGRLIRGSAEVRIVYRVSLYTGAGMRYDDEVAQSVRYRGLSEDFRIVTSEGERVEAGFAEAVERLVTFAYVFSEPDARLLVLRARLDVPEIGDARLVASLWEGAEPRASLSFGGSP